MVKSGPTVSGNVIFRTKAKGNSLIRLSIPDTNTSITPSSFVQKVDKTCPGFSWFFRTEGRRNDANLFMGTGGVSLVITYMIRGRVDYVIYTT